MTQREFDELPALLSKKLFVLATGLERRQIARLVEGKLIRVWRAHEGGYAKFYKSDAARLAGYAQR